MEFNNQCLHTSGLPISDIERDNFLFIPPESFFDKQLDLSEMPKNSSSSVASFQASALDNPLNCKVKRNIHKY